MEGAGEFNSADMEPGGPANSEVAQEYEEGSSDEEEPEVEHDSSGRWSRTNSCIITTKYKTVYNGFDNVEGLDIAWHVIRGGELQLTEAQQVQLYEEVNNMSLIEHARVVNFHGCWRHPLVAEDIVYVTELFTSGTLKQYRMKHRQKKMLKAVRSWLRQIVKGISHLHGMNPPIIHRNIKPSSIFVHGNMGEVKIGDMGMPALFHLQKNDMQYVRYFAPEMFARDEDASGGEDGEGDISYTESVDIYAFGMTMLELVSLEEPYIECATAEEVRERARGGLLPDAVERLDEDQVDFKEVIKLCLAPAGERPTAKQLLQQGLLKAMEPTLSTQDVSSSAAPGPSGAAVQQTKSLSHTDLSSFGRGGLSHALSVPQQAGETGASPRGQRSPGAGGARGPAHRTTDGDSQPQQQRGGQSNHQQSGISLGGLASPPVTPSHSGGGGSAAVCIPISNTGVFVPDMALSPMDYAAKAAIQPSASCKSCLKVEGRLEQDKRMIKLKMSLVDEEGQQRSVQFPFDLQVDTAEDVAGEMREELVLTLEEEKEVCTEINREISLLLELATKNGVDAPP
mmetsp:Transcript_29161/g.93144  ORF Transcript_29161/g.93144 Transcript_29161/m.93144 type:complete len:567 (-) Transcript_29161:90-1790(-)